MYKKWEYCEPSLELVKKISDKFAISELLAKVLVNRDMTKEDDIKIFLSPKRNDFYDPFLMLDMRNSSR